MKTKIDCHLHTKGSDGTGTPEQIAAQAVKAGLDGICITDHHRTYTAESLEVAKACRAKGLLVFHGCEYSTNDGHLLIFGVNVEDLKLGYYPPMQEVIDKVNAAGGAAVPSHPYWGYKNKLADKVFALKGIRALECVNGQNVVQHPDVDAKAVAAAKKLRKLSLGGSDAHFANNVGIAYTLFEGKIRTEKDFIQALKRGQFEARINKPMLKTRKVWNTSSLDSWRSPRQAQIDVLSRTSHADSSAEAFSSLVEGFDYSDPFAYRDH